MIRRSEHAETIEAGSPDKGAAASQRVRLVRDFTFEAAHRLPHVPAGHKCARLHGHSFRLRVICEGAVDPTTGWLIDFADIKKIVQPLIDQVDHYYLNDIDGLSNPTAERIAAWFWERLKPALPVLVQLNVAETCTGRCEYRG